MKATTQLRRLLADEAPLIVPGAYDGASARVIHSLGFPAVYVTGFGMEASLLGSPDIGLASSAEVVGQAGRIAAAVPTPVLCDADTGYGGAINVHRTVREFERAGIAGIHIEDQALPKRCGGMAGRRVVARSEMLERLRAALNARTDPEFVVIARTDCKAEHGVREAIARLEAYLDAGADLAMIAEPYAVSEMQELCRALPGRLVILGGVPGWAETLQPRERYAELGVRVVLYALSGLCAAVGAVRDAYSELLRAGHLSPEAVQRMAPLPEISRIVGLDQWNAIEQAARR